MANDMPNFPREESWLIKAFPTHFVSKYLLIDKGHLEREPVLHAEAVDEVQKGGCPHGTPAFLR